MKKIKVSEATGPVLDWLVAKALGLGYQHDEKYGPMCFRPSSVTGVVHWDSRPLPYSADWSQGGPIIEQQVHELLRCESHFKGKVERYWEAAIGFEDDGKGSHFRTTGPTPLIAAMRCFVASKLGDEVEVPEEVF